MSLKSTIGHILNDISELVYPSSMEGYTINSGIDHGLFIKYYGERLVELPFVFRHIRKPRASVLDIGCSESSTPIQLAMMGYNVTGIDIRNFCYEHNNFKFVKANFLYYKFKEHFDVVLAISSIEHFGLTSYRGTKPEPDADKRSIRKVYSLLKHKGQFIFTAPFGVHEIISNFERVYDTDDIAKLFTGFKIINKEFYKVSSHKVIEKISESEASKIKHEDYRDYAVILINARKIK